MKCLKSLLLVAACVVMTGGCTLLSWGQNTFGQLGDGGTTGRLDPAAAASTIDFVKVEAGYYHSCGIDSTKALYCWGDGWMGDGSIDGHYLTPVHVGVASWKVVVVGATHVCGIRADTS